MDMQEKNKQRINFLKSVVKHVELWVYPQRSHASYFNCIKTGENWKITAIQHNTWRVFYFFGQAYPIHHSLSIPPSVHLSVCHICMSGIYPRSFTNVQLY